MQQESQQAGFKARPLGLPTLVEGQPCIAAVIEISPDSPKSPRGRAGLHGSCPFGLDLLFSLDLLFGLDLAISAPDGMSHAAA